nr:unnamed protein product [Callosobruchus chinensis]
MDAMETYSERTFLGLDLSSQTLKACILNDKLEVLKEVHVNFDSELPECGTTGGAIIDEVDNRHVTAPTIMWVKALDILMDKLILQGVDFTKIAAVSGSAQKLAEITGSRGYERFSGPQIAKIVQTKPEAYQNTERISLISSFLCSIFLGKIAPIDISDGSGMNLLDIRTKKWNQTLLDTCGPNLAEKLGEPVPSYSDVAPISKYFKERYNFNPNCRVIAHTGDNPASLIGMRRNEGWIAVSLGTSDTVFLWLKEPKVVLDGNVLCNPMDKNAYMAMLGSKNGSLTRERMKNKYANGSWDMFAQMLNNTPRGNSGNMGLYYDIQEFLPFLQGEYRFTREGATCKFSTPEVEVRALIEGQFVAKRAYAEEFGIRVGQGTKILATGGASQNKTILQVLADVFNSPVYVFKEANSAMLGAGYQAKYGLIKSSISYEDMISNLPEPELACQPHHDAPEIYTPMVERYRRIVKELTKK